MNYWQTRALVERIVPRKTLLTPPQRQHRRRVGRKVDGASWGQWSLRGEWIHLNQKTLVDEVQQPLEVSCKAAGCPLPLNVDVWDGKNCPYACSYCFANHYKATLWENFFDHTPAGARRADWKALEPVLAGLMGKRGKTAQGGPLERAFAANIPLRVGVRFENFTAAEDRHGVALRLLQLAARESYPVIIDTKSALVGTEPYLRALSDNPAGAVVQLSLILGSDALVDRIEPGAPSPTKRFGALAALNSAGVRGVPRIEPFQPFIGDSPDDVARYLDNCSSAGVKHVCWDTFSNSVRGLLVRERYERAGLDYERMFLSGSESRLLSSLLLHRMMEHFRAHGLSCSTYDDINSGDNDDWLCCAVSGALQGGANRGCTKGAEQFIRSRATPVSWGDYAQWVSEGGGFLSGALESEMRHLWNNMGDPAYHLGWLAVVPCGEDMDGMVWRAQQRNSHLAQAQQYLEAATCPR